MITAAVIISLLYVFLMLFLFFGILKVPVFPESQGPPKNTFSIIVPLRNEAVNLPLLFHSLLKLKYPPQKFEIFLINDASEDASKRLCKEFRKNHPHFQIHLLESIRKTRSPKKDAINTAIEASAMEFMITTDADCRVPETWLSAFDAAIAELQMDVIAGPVICEAKGRNITFLNRFQELDFLSLQAATIGGFGVNMPFICNGANFCYSKNAFMSVNGFEGNEEIASGDDVLLLEKFQKKGVTNTFLRSREAIVTTNPASDLRALFSQRIRWAAKASGYQNSFGKFTGLIVFLMNLALLAGAAAGIFQIFPLEFLGFMFLLKFNIDILFIYKSAKFFRRESSIKGYFWSSIIYPFFSSIVVFLSLFSKFEWKGRHFRR